MVPAKQKSTIRRKRKSEKEEFRCKGFTKRKPYHNARLEYLKQCMLRIGGWAVKLQEDGEELVDDYEAEMLVTRGRPFDATWKIFEGEFPRMCHHHSAVLSMLVNDLQLGTGFGLSEDGVWYQHSWCSIEYEDGSFDQIDTTTARQQYYGVILDIDEHTEFLESLNEMETHWSYSYYSDKLKVDSKNLLADHQTLLDNLVDVE